MKKLKKILYPLCALILILAAWNLWKIKASTDQAQKLYDGLSKKARTVQEEEDKERSESNQEENEDSSKKKTNSWLAKLQKENDELVAWIKIPGTVIDYPVMQTEEDNDYYLTHDFNREENVHGAPFLDVNCKLGASDNLIIYGHHMRDKTMFQNLMLYENADFCKSNGTIYFDTLDSSQQYQVILVMLISAEEAEDFPYYKGISFSNNDSFQAYLTQCSKYAIWQSDTLPDSKTQLLTLSTCEYSKENGRLVVIAEISS